MDEPFDAAGVMRVAKALYNQKGFSDWRRVNEDRRALLYHIGGVDIPGVWTRLEDIRSDLEFHSSLFVSRLSAASFRAHVAARSSEPAARAAAQRTQNFIYAFNHDYRRSRTNSRSADDPVRGMIDQMTNYGMGIERLDLKRDVLGALGNEEFGSDDALIAAAQEFFSAGFPGNPFQVENPDLLACAWEEDYSVVCEVGVRTYSITDLDRDVEDEAAIWDLLTSATRSDESFSWSQTNQAVGERTVKSYHLETRNFIYDVISPMGIDQGYMTQCRPTLIGRPWYAFCPGRRTSERTPNEGYRPLLAPLYPIVQALNVLGTLLNSGAFQTGRPVYQEVALGAPKAADIGSWLQMPSNERPVLRFDIVSEAVLKPREGFQLIPLAVPSQQWLLDAYTEKKRELSQYGFPPPLSPDPSQHGEASSGYHAAIQVDQSNLHIDPALRNIASAHKELSLIAMDVLRALDLAVTIPLHPIAQGRSGYLQQVTVRPSDLRDQDIFIELDAKPATAQFAQKESDLREYQSGMKSRQGYMVLHYDDPQDEQDRIDLEKFADGVKELARQQAMAIIQQQAQTIAQDVAASLGIPAPAQIPQPGGPAPGEEARFARPPDGAVPGAGAPLQPPEQTEPMQGVPMMAAGGP